MKLQTEFDFTLPKGFVDREGSVHREGTMRLATAADEIEPLRDPRVKQNPAYLVIILLARVVTKLGTIPGLTPLQVEGLFSTDLAYLQNFYRRINAEGAAIVRTKCPNCGSEVEVSISEVGVARYPLEQIHEEVAYIAYHFHWSMTELLDMEHLDRRMWVEEIDRINRRRNEEDAERISEMRQIDI